MKKRVDPSAGNNHAICMASRNGHIAVVDRLLQYDRTRPKNYNDLGVVYPIVLIGFYLIIIITKYLK